ncbi:MAG: NUDIX hydrolase [Bacteroidia bacterium]
MIRPIALCVFRRGDAILVAEGYDPSTQEHFYRPLGGGLEFGEYSWEAVRREIKEELGEEIKNLTFIGPAENVFQYHGNMSHEIIFMFEGEFVNKDTYKREVVLGREDNGEEIRAVWKPLSDFRKNRARLYPEGLLDMLAR